MDNKLRKRFTKNLIYAFSAQGISFLFSVLMSLLVPKMLGVVQYAYWQLFIFYSTYVGLFHFGLSDGVYLRYGGTNIEELDSSRIGAQFKVMFVGQCLICALALPILLPITDSPERQFVLILTAFYLVIANAAWYLGYLFQAVNQTSIYSTSIIISKALYIIFVVSMFLLKPENFRLFVVFYVVAQLIALLYVLYEGRQFLITKSIPLKEAVSETISNIKIGINLTISNIVSSLILGVGRAMVDASEGISSFGLLSLAISLTNFFLQFVAQVSMVMFPALRQVNKEKIKELFIILRSGISYILCGILLMYTPLKLVLGIWLPQYETSLYYLSVLLPICIFDGKMQLIYNTYMKILRKERMLLAINIVSLATSVMLCAIGAFIIKNIVAVAIAMTVAIALRSVIANVYLSKLLEVQTETNLVWEIFFSLLFIILNTKMSTSIAFCSLLVFYILYVTLHIKEIKKIVTILKRTIN